MNYFSKAALFILFIFTAYFQSASADDALQTAIDGMHRSEANKNRDAVRHPKETLEFFGIEPQMTVVELMPGAGWYTEILAPYLMQRGQLIAALQDPQSKSDYGRKNALRFEKKLNDNSALYDKVITTVFEPPAKLHIAPENSVDMVLTFRNVHNWLKGGDENMKQIFENVYASLKKGGVFGVVEHRLPADKKQDSTSGYVSEAYVIQLAESVGFKLAAKSEINANPKDTADHKGGVWALPPKLVNKETDRQKYIAIGESDRMTLKFVKE